eukprot:6200782-Pleurochrysis_carterae.AAC.3
MLHTSTPHTSSLHTSTLHASSLHASSLRASHLQRDSVRVCLEAAPQNRQQFAPHEPAQKPREDLGRISVGARQCSCDLDAKSERSGE